MEPRNVSMEASADRQIARNNFMDKATHEGFAVCKHRGGVSLPRVVKVDAAGSTITWNSKKLRPRYLPLSEVTSVRMHWKDVVLETRTRGALTLRCKSTAETESLCLGLRILWEDACTSKGPGVGPPKVFSARDLWPEEMDWDALANTGHGDDYRVDSKKGASQYGRY